jgi:putative peptidoglycan lipid II flippase
MISATLFSKALGLLRNMILAWTLGAKAEAAAFAAASRIPGALFDLLFSAAIAACFIPAYNKAGAESETEAGDFSAAFFGAVLLFSAVLSCVGVLFAPQIIAFSAPGLTGETADLAARLLRIMFPMVVFAAGAYTLTGILQSMGAFLLPASVSAISNAFTVIYLLFAGKSFSVYALAAVYVFSWLLQFLTLALPLLAKRRLPCPKINFSCKKLRACLSSVPKIMAGSLLSPALLLAAAFFASFVSERAFVLYDYAHGIYAIAAGITVYGIGNFTFPRLSRFFAQGEQKEAERELARALCAVFAVTLPVAASVAVLSRDAVLLLYGRGSFGAELIPVCAGALGILSSAMPAGAAAEIFSRAFYASGKNGAPAKAACTAISVCIAANAISLFFGAGLFGICAAFSAAVWAHALSLLRFAVREFQEALRAARKIALLAPAFLLCTAIMAFLAKKTEFFSSFPETIATFLKIAIVFTVGNVIYLICIYIMGFLRPEKRKEVE